MSATTTAKVASKKVKDDNKKETRKEESREIVHVNPKDILSELGENPRFDVPGLTPNQAAGAYFQSDEYQAVARSLDKHGVQQPVLVEPIENGRYRVLDGWSRVYWATQAKKKTIPCIVRHVEDDKERITLRVALNSARRDYAPIAQARSFQRIVSVWGDEATAAKQIGVTKTFLRQRLRLLRLPEDLQSLIASGRITLSAIETMCSQTGYEEYILLDSFLKDETKEKPSETMLAKAERFEKFMKRVINLVKTDDGQYTYTEIVKIWNQFLAEAKEDKKTTQAAKPAKKDKKTKEEDAPEDEDEPSEESDESGVGELVLVRPPQSVIDAWLLSYAHVIAKSMLGESSPSPTMLAKYIDRIENIGTAMGSCVCADAHPAFKEADVNVLSESVAQQTCDLFVREHVYTAVVLHLQSKGGEMEKGNPLASNAGWSEFIAKEQPMEQGVRFIQKAFNVPAKKAK